MQHPDFDVNGWIRREMENLMGNEQPDFDMEEDRRRYDESEAIVNGMGPTLDESRRQRKEWSEAIEQVPETAGEVLEILNERLDTSDIQKPLRNPSETRSAIGDHGAWQDWYIEHSNCGGTWVYVKDPRNPRVVCSCTMGLGFND